MKWKGRRESANVEDGRGESVEVTIEDLINDDFIPNGPVNTGKPDRDKVEKWKKTHSDKMAENEIRKLDKRGKIPTPTPRPKGQVTPGDWKTNNKI